MVIRSSFFRRGPDPDETAPEPHVAAGDRIYAVGDIHGRADLLAAMLEKIHADIVRTRDERLPRIVFLGDYIDRGDQSRETLEMLTALGQDFAGAKLTFLRGNHEAALLAFLADPTPTADWLRHGGLQTLASYGITPPKFPASDVGQIRDALAEALGGQRAFLEETRLFMSSGKVVFCHAGLDPDRPLKAQSERTLLWGCPGFLAAGGIKGIRVVHGHYAASQAVVTPLRICVDTGAYFSGRLTAVRLDQGTELLSVTAFETF